MIHIVDLGHVSFQYLIDTVYLLSRNINTCFYANCDWMKNVERFHKNEGGDQLMIIFCILLLMLSMYSQFITRFRAMASLLGDLSYAFGDDGVVWYDFISELVANMNGYVLIETGDVICWSEVGLLLVGTLNATIE